RPGAAPLSRSRPRSGEGLLRARAPLVLGRTGRRAARFRPGWTGRPRGGAGRAVPVQRTSFRGGGGDAAAGAAAGSGPAAVPLGRSRAPPHRAAGAPSAGVRPGGAGSGSGGAGGPLCIVRSQSTGGSGGSGGLGRSG